MSKSYWDKESYAPELRTLLQHGRVICDINEIESEDILDEEVRAALDLLIFTAKHKSPILKHEIGLATIQFPWMSSLAIAALCASAPEKYVSRPDVKQFITSVLWHMDPDMLMEFVDYLRPKTLGRGFGSRPQKLLRKVMHEWNETTLEKYILEFKESMILLVKLVHPKYQGYKGELIKMLLEK